MPDYPDEEYTDEEEYSDNFLEEQRDSWDESMGNYPSARKPESLFSLFRDVWRTSDSTKVANLNKTEIGDLGMSVRDCQNLSKFSRFLGHKGVSKYFNTMSEITLSTSMSRNGWFPELFVSSKKFAHKGTLHSGGSGEQKNNKWKIFGRKTNIPESGGA